MCVRCHQRRLPDWEGAEKMVWVRKEWGIVSSKELTLETG